MPKKTESSKNTKPKNSSKPFGEDKLSQEEARKYKEEQRKRMASYVVGAKDANGMMITKIFSTADEWVIYEVKTNNIAESIRLRIDTETEKDQKGAIENFNQIRSKYTEIKATYIRL